MFIPIIVEVVKIVVAVSILFVWVVRYNNIVSEFKHYMLPDWSRDLIGIGKISLAMMVLTTNPVIVTIGAFGLSVLMIGALAMHLKVSNPVYKMIPAFLMLSFNIFILFTNY